jgi:hypothetical protein
MESPSTSSVCDRPGAKRRKDSDCRAADRDYPRPLRGLFRLEPLPKPSPVELHRTPNLAAEREFFPVIIKEKAAHAGELGRLVNSDPLMVMDRARLPRPGDEQWQHRSRSDQSCFCFLGRHGGDFIRARQSIGFRHDDPSACRATSRTPFF